MEKIDLSTNAKSIEDSYSRVVRNNDINYVVYTVNKLVVEVSATGSGDLHDFVDNFSDGHVQFGLARVTVPGSDVFKNLLLGWCPDNAPAKSRLSFASNFADIASVLKGYHVQVTARDRDDLNVDDFLSRIGAAAGARYSIQSTTASAKPVTNRPSNSVPKPASLSKPAFVPKSTGNPINLKDQTIIKPKPPVVNKPSVSKPVNDVDEWDGENEIEERDFSEKPLENVPSAYTPTKVNIDELRKGKSDTISSQPKSNPIEPSKPEPETPKSFDERFNAYKLNDTSSDGRLTSLPKPKISNSVASRFTGASNPTSFGSKPPIKPLDNRKDKLVSDNRDFASENGKTPAQIWAEKRGKYKVVDQTDDVLTNNVEKLEINQKEPEPEPEPVVESKPSDFKEPTIIKPVSEFPAPPVRNLPPREEKREPIASPEPQFEPEPVAEPEPEPQNEKFLETKPGVEELPEALPIPSSVVSSTVTAIAEFAYEKDEDNEIGFEEGDLIIEIEFVDDDWWSGKHSKTGEVGLFPSSYVVVKQQSTPGAPEPTPISESPAPSLPTRNQTSESSPPSLPSRREPGPVEPKSDKPSATAEFAYEKDEDNEIDFDEGDVIVEIEFVDEDWWSGKNVKTGETGLFPGNYVKLNN